MKIVTDRILDPGEYRVLVIAFGNNVGKAIGRWQYMIESHVLGAGTARLIVKPSPESRKAEDSEMKKTVVFLPDADSGNVNAILDLASGKLLPAGEGVEQLSVFRDLGKGDLAWDRVLICLRGAEA